MKKRKQSALTREIRHCLELLLPELGDGDGLSQVVARVGRHPLLASMAHDLLEIFRIDRVQDIEEILARRALIFRKLVREVLCELLVLRKLWPERLHRQLVVEWYSYRLDLRLLQKHLVAGQHVLQEVLVHNGLVGEVILNWKEISRRGLVYLRCLSR